VPRLTAAVWHVRRGARVQRPVEQYAQQLCERRLAPLGAIVVADPLLLLLAPWPTPTLAVGIALYRRPASATAPGAPAWDVDQPADPQGAGWTLALTRCWAQVLKRQGRSGERRQHAPV